MSLGKKNRAKISGVAHWVPEKILSNKELEKMVDTTDEWITSRTGIKERHILEAGKASSDMAAEACKILFEKTGTDPDDIDVIVFGTVTPDMLFPASACLLQAKLGMSKAWGFDVSAACCGFAYSLVIGAQFIESGSAKKVLVVGSDKMSSIVDYTDRNTCILFGDAAGVVLLEKSEDEKLGILDYYNTVDGNGAQYLNMPGGGSLNPPTHETVDKKMHTIYQDGKNVYQYAVKGMSEASALIVERNGLSGKDVGLFVPHQANKRIIDSAAQRMGLKDDQVIINIEKYGNTTAATIPMALSEAVTAGRIKKGDYVVIAAFGGGFTCSSILVKWAY
ncbi:ketoacyl-ACP synthase III [bacterium]|nr:MAG: ketoacyl-ACP synthase III [bacterium]